jgi:hypothetical protein
MTHLPAAEWQAGHDAAVVKLDLTTELEQFAQNANCPDLKGQI